jgi:putative nucleotidyltransferase with HDIG domain
MEQSHFFKNVLNSDTINESLEHILDFAKEHLACDHICSFVFDKNQGNDTVSSYGVNIQEAELNKLRELAVETDYFTNIPEGISINASLYLHRAYRQISDHVKSVMQFSAFRSLFAFELKYEDYTGTLIFCYQEVVQLCDDRHQICNLIRLHMEYLIEKIHFRKQILKQTVYENLFNTLRIKDGFTVNHSYNVSFYASLLGSKLGLSASELDKLKIASLLHDIGKLATPEQILLKPGRLTEVEFEIIRNHPIMGYELLKHFPHVEDVLPIVRWHHERPDGQGYPDKLYGSEIPYLVKIVSLADAFDAMTSTRVYRASLSFDEVKKQLLVNAGSQFDEAMTPIFMDVINDQMKTNPYSLALNGGTL